LTDAVLHLGAVYEIVHFTVFTYSVRLEAHWISIR
jgi:hypothetical protein